MRIFDDIKRFMDGQGPNNLPRIHERHDNILPSERLQRLAAVDSFFRRAGLADKADLLQRVIAQQSQAPPRPRVAVASPVPVR